MFWKLSSQRTSLPDLLDALTGRQLCFGLTCQSLVLSCNMLLLAFQHFSGIHFVEVRFPIQLFCLGEHLLTICSLKFSNMSENISESPPFPACAIIFFAKHIYVCSDLEVKGMCTDLDIWGIRILAPIGAFLLCAFSVSFTRPECHTANQCSSAQNSKT